jgi:hypothetical protein
MEPNRRSRLARRVKPAPKLTIRRQLSRRLRIALVTALCMVGIAMGAIGYALGRGMIAFHGGTGVDADAQLQRRIDRIDAERDRIASSLNASESQLAIERSAKEQMASQLKALEIENAQLQEDLSFFENLLPAGSVSQDISIRRLKIDIVAQNQLRYRMLVMRHGKTEQNFHGNLQLAVDLAGSGGRSTLTFPEKNDSDTDQFKLGFRHYQRIEGILKLPEGSQVKSVQARVYENGKLRSQQSANL